MAGLAAFTPMAGQAQSFSVTPVGGVTVEAGVGVLNGFRKEYVYDAPTGIQISKLKWRMDTIGMLHAGAHYRPWSFLMLGIKGGTSLSSSGHMEDFDWIAGCPNNVCRSIHPDTRTQNAMMLDAFVAARFLEVSGISVAAIAGYKWDYYQWHAFNGTANYAPPFTNGLGITYEQSWETPYLGLGVDGQFGRLGVSARAVGSVWASGNDRDHHHNRSLLFTEPFDQGGFVATDIGVSYRLTDNVRVAVDYHYQRFMESKGPTTVKDLFSGATFLFPGDAAGGGNQSHMLTAGLKINLQRDDDRYEHNGSLKDDSHDHPRSDWAGFYAGALIAADLVHHDFRATGLLDPPFAAMAPIGAPNASLDDIATNGGLFLGHNWSVGRRWIWGVEAEVGKSNASDYVHGIPGTAVNLNGSPDSVVVESGWNASLRIRAGVLVTDHLNIYATGGVAAEQITARASCTTLFLGGPWCIDDHFDPVHRVRTGYTVGAGAEALLAGGWLVRGEYRFTDYGTERYDFFADAPSDTVHADIETSSHRLSLGIGFRFF
ncbi:MAG: omptin family outer membrane protease [Hyphomicrobiaceae bacterium]|nr:omptin family outer membrane protease [Hyphomicrobiaceae bacterium]